jgi:hypothetical protein
MCANEAARKAEDVGTPLVFKTTNNIKKIAISIKVPGKKLVARLVCWINATNWLSVVFDILSRNGL